MGVDKVRPIYPFAEMIECTMTGTTAVSVRKIAAGEVIQGINSVIKTAGVRAAGATTFIVGDDDDDNGFIVASDAKAAAGTVYGEDPTVRGAYLYDSTKKGSFNKVYRAEGKTIKAVESVANDTEAVIQFLIWGFRANLE